MPSGASVEPQRQVVAVRSCFVCWSASQGARPKFPSMAHLQKSANAPTERWFGRLEHEPFAGVLKRRVMAPDPCGRNLGMYLTLEPGKSVLTRRIHRYLLVLERYLRRPTQREAYCILLAVECVREGRVADDIEAMNAAKHIDAIPVTVLACREVMTTRLPLNCAPPSGA